jgi:hypothetical protein
MPTKRLAENLRSLVKGDPDAKRLISALRNHPEEYEAFWHPLGFVHIKIVGVNDTRIHLWPLNARFQEPHFGIHDHVFRIHSVVLFGSLTSVTYMIEAESKSPTHCIYEVDYQPGRSLLLRSGNRIRCQKVEETMQPAGTAYTVAPGLFHSSERAGLEPAVSLVRTSQNQAVRPRVVGPLDGPSSYEYVRTELSTLDLRAVLDTYVLS